MAQGTVIGYDPNFDPDKPVVCNKCGWCGQMADCRRHVTDSVQNRAVYYCPGCGFTVSVGEWIRTEEGA